MSKEHLTLQPAVSLCLQCHFRDEFCELCKTKHCVCMGYKEENHPTEEHKVKGAFRAFHLRKSNKKLKVEDLIEVTFIMKHDGQLNQKLGGSTARPGIEGSIWTKNTYPVTKDSVRYKELRKEKKQKGKLSSQL